MENLLTPKQLADRWNKKESTLATWRHKKIGPAFVKIMGGVRYPLDAVVAFEKEAEEKAKAECPAR